MWYQGNTVLTKQKEQIFFWEEQDCCLSWSYLAEVKTPKSTLWPGFWNIPHPPSPISCPCCLEESMLSFSSLQCRCYPVNWKVFCLLGHLGYTCVWEGLSYRCLKICKIKDLCVWAYSIRDSIFFFFVFILERLLKIASFLIQHKHIFPSFQIHDHLYSPPYPLPSISSSKEKKKTGLQETTAEQDKIGYNKRRQKPSYCGLTRSPSRWRRVPRADKFQVCANL